MPSKRDKRNSTIGNREGAPTLSPDLLAQLGYNMRLDEQESDQQVEIPAGAIVPQGDGTWMVGDFHLTSTGVKIPDGTDTDSWTNLGDLLFRLNGAIQWLIGDWLNYGKREWGKTYEEIAEATGYEVETLYNIASVCSTIQFSYRNENLSFTHHSVVAHLPDSLKGREIEVLNYAEKNGLSVRDLRGYIKSLLATKPKRIPAASLFTKERAPQLGHLRSVYMKARRGDKNAIAQLRESVKHYHQWLDEIEQSLGIK